MQEKSGYRIKQGAVKVVFQNGSHKWYRLSRAYVDNIVQGFLNMPNFKYAKVYAFTRGKTKGTGTVEHQIGYFGVKSTGEFYQNWNL